MSSETAPSRSVSQAGGASVRAVRRPYLGNLLRLATFRRLASLRRCPRPPRWLASLARDHIPPAHSSSQFLLLRACFSPSLAMTKTSSDRDLLAILARPPHNIHSRNRRPGGWEDREGKGSGQRGGGVGANMTLGNGPRVSFAVQILVPCRRRATTNGHANLMLLALRPAVHDVPCCDVRCSLGATRSLVTATANRLPLPHGHHRCLCTLASPSLRRRTFAGSC